ncbi:L,D-transpeptidase family protein [Massilia sp. TWP1-3-3]|uniref:L,D-transpeptidase family protein n=1 Tax=Massilia sp. TWP1-3-3 TaxID=2804573 RepID=UPI003CED04FD
MTPSSKPFASLALAVLFSLASITVHAGTPDDIRVLAATAKQAQKSGQLTYDQRDWLERFYAPRAYAPVWLGANLSKAAAAVVLLQEAAVHGLSPADYDADGLAAKVRSASLDDAALDVALTRAMLQYMADLRVGRVRSEYHSATPDPRLTAFDPVEQLRGAVEQNTLAAAVAKAEPRIALYKYMKHTLAHYRQLAKAPVTSLPPIAKGDKIEVGASYPAAPALRALLLLVGDEPGAASAPDDKYGADLAAAVKRFQARHGLLDDGILGPDTVAAMNTPLSQRVRQLELTLERLRWLPDFSNGPIVAVNLPAFRLWAINNGDTNGPPPLEMRVIVGTAVKTQTPLFVGSMRYLEFNPYWNVPPSIQKAELIPKIAKDGSYLAKNEMELVAVSGAGEPVRNVDAAVMADLRAGKYRIRQRPGAGNALGAVKFAMPNPDNIYLHSTSARELFKRTRRDLSHGCIRVEKPQELAQFVLAGKPEWTKELIGKAMEPGPQKTVNLKTPIPVVLFYATAVSGRDGHAIFSQDVYKRDPVLEKLLSARSAAAAPDQLSK